MHIYIFILGYWGWKRRWHYPRLVKCYVQLFRTVPIQGHLKPSPRQYASRQSKVSFSRGPPAVGLITASHSFLLTFAMAFCSISPCTSESELCAAGLPQTECYSGWFPMPNKLIHYFQTQPRVSSQSIGRTQPCSLPGYLNGLESNSWQNRCPTLYLMHWDGLHYRCSHWHSGLAPRFLPEHPIKLCV